MAAFSKGDKIVVMIPAKKSLQSTIACRSGTLRVPKWAGQKRLKACFDMLQSPKQLKWSRNLLTL